MLLLVVAAGAVCGLLALALRPRIDRACDVTDVVDNVTGAVVGAALGVALALLLRPWRRRRPH